MTAKSHQFETIVSQFVTDFQTLPKNVWTIRKCLLQVIQFCDHQTHSRQDDIDENWMDRKSYYNKYIGWTIPSWDMLSQIKSVQKQMNMPLCDYGSGSGLMTHLLKLMDCLVYGVDLKEGWPNVGKFYQPDILMTGKSIYHVPIDHIFLVSWGYLPLKGSPLDDYIERGGKCIIIIGEDGYGCTYPSYDYVNSDSWRSTIVEIPNFYGIHTKMSINIRL